MRKKNLQQNKRARIKLRLKGRAWVKLRRMILTVIAAAALAIPAAAMAMEVDIPYEQDFTNDSAKPSVADSFNYRLTADDSAPMPEGSSGGSYDFSLAGDTKGVLKLNISYAKPGYYYYTVKSHEKSSKKGYTYESKVYKVMVMIINGSDGLQQGALTIQDASLDKYDKMLFEPSYYQKRPDPDPDPDPDPNPTPDPDPDNGGGNNPGGGGVTPADGTPTPEPPTTIDDPEPPLAGVEQGEDYWALINLICMILTWITAILGLIFFIRRRNQASKIEDQNAEALKTGGRLEELEDPNKLKRKGIIRIVTIVVAIISLILFILTEDMTLPMELWDEWTIWMIILLIIALVLALLSKKATEEPDQQPGPEPGT